MAEITSCRRRKELLGGFPKQSAKKEFIVYRIFRENIAQGIEPGLNLEVNDLKAMHSMALSSHSVACSFSTNPTYAAAKSNGETKLRVDVSWSCLRTFSASLLRPDKA